MKRAVTALIALVAIAGPVSPLLAKGPDHCPPGLAKKSPTCVPPGLAKKQYQGDDRDDDDRYHRYDDDDGHRRYRRYDGTDYGDYRPGDRIPDGYELILVPKDYGLPDPEDGTDYFIVNDVIFKASRETQEIIDLYRAVGAVLN